MSSSLSLLIDGRGVWADRHACRAVPSVGHSRHYYLLPHRVIYCSSSSSSFVVVRRRPLLPPPPTRLYSEDGSDYQLITQSPIPGGSTVIYVPSEVVLSSERVVAEFGGSLQQAENVLVQMDQGTQARLPLFRLMVKVLAEYDAGEDSPFYPWLNSLPKQFYNGVSMTDACFACLPPYAGWLVSEEGENG